MAPTVVNNVETLAHLAPDDASVYLLMAAVLALVPGHHGVRWAVRRYTKRMVQLMKLVGIKPETRGMERLPPPPFIVAPKHSSYGDGFMMYVQFKDIAFVTGDHLERFPLVPKVLEKLGAIVIDNCGGPEARRDLEAWLDRLVPADDRHFELRRTPKVGQDGSLIQNPKNDLHVQETTSAQS